MNQAEAIKTLARAIFSTGIQSGKWVAGDPSVDFRDGQANSDAAGIMQYKIGSIANDLQEEISTLRSTILGLRRELREAAQAIGTARVRCFDDTAEDLLIDTIESANRELDRTKKYEIKPPQPESEEQKSVAKAYRDYLDRRTGCDEPDYAEVG